MQKIKGFSISRKYNSIYKMSLVYMEHRKFYLPLPNNFIFLYMLNK